MQIIINNLRKKHLRFCLFISILFIVLTVLFAPCYGASKHPQVTYNGEPVIYTDFTGHPFIDRAGRMQVPLRQTMESFGCMVSWDPYTRTVHVTKDNRVITAVIGENSIKTAVIDLEDYDSEGEQYEVILNDTAATIKGDRSYLPIRIVLETFGAQIDWNGETRTAQVITKFPLEVPTGTSAGIDIIELDQSWFYYLDKSRAEIIDHFGEYDEQGYIEGGEFYSYDGFAIVFDDEGKCSWIYLKSEWFFANMGSSLTRLDMDALIEGTPVFIYEPYLAQILNGGPTAYTFEISGHPMMVSCDLEGEVSLSDVVLIQRD